MFIARQRRGLGNETDTLEAGLLLGMGLELNVPRRLFPEVDYAKELWLKISRDDLAQWRGTAAELADRLNEVLTGIPSLAVSGFTATRTRSVVPPAGIATKLFAV